MSNEYHYSQNQRLRVIGHFCIEKMDFFLITYPFFKESKIFTDFTIKNNGGEINDIS